MRPDQYSKLQDLSEKLTDRFIEEADPENWPGAGVPVARMDKQTRGDSYWCRKVAIGTLSLVMRIDTLVGKIQQQSNTGDGANAVHETEDELDAEIAAAEKEAARLLSQAQKSAAKAQFDKRVHGKG